MLIDYTELTPQIRASAAAELDAELTAKNPFYPARLTPSGREHWHTLMRSALTHHDDEWLMNSLLEGGKIVAFEPYSRSRIGERAVNPSAAAQAIAMTEYNTWYVRGLAAELLREGVAAVQVYRAAQPRRPSADCDRHDGQTYPTQLVYDGHRARYWPASSEKFSIPFHPNCHHSIERAPAASQTTSRLLPARAP